jgi:glycosyltransferase involved in cell wall biosynthesis
MPKPVITILVPMYNEEAVLPLLFDELNKVTASMPECDFEYLFVDDGSRDASLSIVKNYAASDKRISYIGLSRNFGKERALLAGFDHVNGDAVVVIDADLQDPPELIREMIRWWQQGYQDVYAQRTSRTGETWLKRTTSTLYYRILQSVTRVEIQADTGDFRLLDRACIEALKQFRETERNTKAMFSWIGFRKKAIQYDRDARAAGSTKFNYWRLLNLAIDGLTSFTTAPLRASAVLGFAVSIFAFIYLLEIVIKGIITGSDVSGYPSTMAAILFLGGVQLLSLGIIGEYVGKVFNETKNRPPYLIGDTNVSGVETSKPAARARKK